MRVPLLAIVLMTVLASPVTADSGLPEKWEKILANDCNGSTPGARVVCLSGYFLDTPYRAATLGGGPGKPEKLIVRLGAVDCFTLLDYIEAMRRSASPELFLEELTAVRYRDGIVAWPSRHHFFSDWLQGGAVLDVTADLAPQTVETVVKTLNRAADGAAVLPEVAQRQRRIAYLPTDTLTPAIVAGLQPGDYIGIYSPKEWLDVSHVGVLVRKRGVACLRHASSRSGVSAVVDEPLHEYLDGKPGIVVLRPVAP